MLYRDLIPQSVKALFLVRTNQTSPQESLILLGQVTFGLISPHCKLSGTKLWFSSRVPIGDGILADVGILSEAQAESLEVKGPFCQWTSEVASVRFLGEGGAGA